jgi:hypothetical protein
VLGSDREAQPSALTRELLLAGYMRLWFGSFNSSFN